MAKMIFISPYLRGGKNAATLSNRAHYIATRDGVEKLMGDRGDEPPTTKQEQFIERVVKSFPEAKELPEYEGYLARKTKDTAAALIDEVWEEYVSAQDQRENFLDYVSHRPGVKLDGDHGLWNQDGKVPVLSKVMEEVANHDGIIWTPVVSIRREDAERLGFTDADNWRNLVNSCTAEIAKGYKISPKNLRWYAALHEKANNYHIHMLIFSANPREGYLTKEGIRQVKSAFATHIFQQDLVQVYEQKTAARELTQESAEHRMIELIRQMEIGAIENERLEQLTGELVDRLQNTKGKKVYGYLPPATKRIVDAIVDELSKDQRVASAYKLWQDMKEEVCRTYASDPPQRFPLSQQKEFKPVRNMVIREALKLGDTLCSFDDREMEDEPEEIQLTEQSPGQGQQVMYQRARRYRDAKAVLQEEKATQELKAVAVQELRTLWEEGYTAAAHQLGKCYRDGVGVKADLKLAVEWFQKSAEAGNSYSQYTLGKLYLLGKQVPQDMDQAQRYLSQSAAQGNIYAQYCLDHINDWQTATVGSCVVRMLHHMGNIFREQAASDTFQQGMQIDKKQRAELQEKRIAMGHKPDDHPDYTGPTMSAPW